MIAARLDRVSPNEEHHATFATGSLAMNAAGGRRWLGKYATEFVVIVIGVFVALAAETWWSEREDRLLEREIRDDMAAEFASNIRILEADIETNVRMAERFARLTTLSDEELLEQSDAWFNENVRPFPDWAGFDPEIGIVQAVINSGTLSDISDPEFRLRLSRWAGLSREDQRKTGIATDFQMIAMMPAIAAMSADRAWSEEERRNARALYDTLAFLHSLVLDSQRALLDEARRIHDYLAEDA